MLDSDIQRIVEKSEKIREDGFDRFMRDETTKLLVSMVPASDPPEILETLLKKAFTVGYGTGEGSMIGGFMEMLLKKPKAGDRQ